MVTYSYTRIVLPSGQEWPEFKRPTIGIELPYYASFIVGGQESKGYGNRVLTIRVSGVVIQPCIDAALEIASKLGLDATVALNDTHFNALVKASKNTNIYLPAKYKADAEYLAEKLELTDQRGNPSISALFRYLIDKEKGAE